MPDVQGAQIRQEVTCLLLSNLGSLHVRHKYALGQLAGRQQGFGSLVVYPFPCKTKGIQRRERGNLEGITRASLLHIPSLLSLVSKE